MTEQQAPKFPMRRTNPFTPPSEYERLRREAPVSQVTLPSGDRAWVLTRNDDVRAMLTDRRFISDHGNPAFPSVLDNSELAADLNPALIGMDGPDHLRARRALAGEFSAKRLQVWRPRIQQVVDECIDAILAGPQPADLVPALAVPVPLKIVCELLGMPYSDAEFLHVRTEKWTERSTSAPDRQAAFDELKAYFDDLVGSKEREPGEDLLSRYIVKQQESGSVDHDGLVATAFMFLLAGHDTVFSMIPLGIVALLENPGQLAKIREDPAKTPNAVEELLRYCTIADVATSRVAIEDAEIGGVLIHAGEGVIGLGNAANRDPDEFERPDDLDVERNALHHVALGYGAHRCIGQDLGRVELQVIYDTLFRRIPGLRLAKPVEELPFKNDSTLYGLYELPVTW
jgi:cytochrome P450